MSGRRNAAQLLAGMLVVFCVAARSESSGFEGERSHIEAQRQEQSRELDALEQACHSRFAVTDCVNRVRTQRRQRMAELDLRVAHINNAQRLEQAAQSRQTRQAKLVERQRRDAERAANSATAQTEAQSRPEAGERGRPSADGRGTDRAAKSGNNVDSGAREASKARFLKKQQDAQERRVLREQRLKEPVPAHLALPLPP